RPDGGQVSHVSACDFLQFAQVDVVRGDTGGVHGGAFTEDEDGAVAPLIVQGEAGRRGNGGVAVAQGDGLEVVVHPLPELAFTVIGLGLVEARELRVHVHDLL